MKISNVLGCVGWAAFLLSAAAWIPIFGPFLNLLTPLPFLFYSTKLGFYKGVMLAALAVIIIGVVAKLAGFPQIAVFGVEFSLFGLFLAELFRRKVTLGQTICLATAFMLVLGFGFLVILALSRDMGPVEMMRSYLQDHLTASIKAYEQMGMSPEGTGELEAFGKAFVDAVSKVFPALMIMGTGFAVWLNVIIAKPLFRMGNLEYPDFFPLDRWSAPDRMVWGVIASGFALFLTSGGIKLTALNALIVMMGIYMFHGLSIILFFFNKYNVPTWVRVGVYIVIIIQQLFLGILALAGLFDQWVDFRKIRKRAAG